MTTVLLIDNNHDYREAFKGRLEERGLEVLDADCPDSAFRVLRHGDTPDLIVCDLHMPFSTGEDACDFKTSYEVGLRTMRELAWVFPEATVLALAELTRSDLDRLRPYLDTFPAYPKPPELSEAVGLVTELLASREWGGVQ